MPSCAITDGLRYTAATAADDHKAHARGAAAVRSDRDGSVQPLLRHLDRDYQWERTSKAYNNIRPKPKDQHFADAPAVVADAYANKKFDEFIMPAVVGDYRGMKDGDGILCFNFRADRVREFHRCHALRNPNFSGFPRRRFVRFAAAVGMTQYSDELEKLMRTIFPPQSFANILGEVVAAAGRKQLRMAETEKYPHVTYFLNGGREEPYSGEDRIMVPSPKVATYDLQPDMSAPELARQGSRWRSISRQIPI